MGPGQSKTEEGFQDQMSSTRSKKEVTGLSLLSSEDAVDEKQCAELKNHEESQQSHLNEMPLSDVPKTRQGDGQIEDASHPKSIDRDEGSQDQKSSTGSKKGVSDLSLLSGEGAVDEKQCAELENHEESQKSLPNEMPLSDALNTRQGDGQIEDASHPKSIDESKSHDVNVVTSNMKHSRLVVAAIDFGTHGSGLAFCTRAVYRNNSSQIFVQNWNSGKSITSKAPTTILIKPNGNDYISFGYDAESDFFDMEPEERKKHYLFRQFKMELYNNNDLSGTTTIKDISGKSLPAVDVFSAVIRCFKEILERHLQNCTTESSDKSLTKSTLNSDDVYWVITVPAIWDLGAKQFMRKAAEKTGLKDSQISLVLEPEAASLYCRRIPMEISMNEDGAKQIASLQPGSKYLVIDLGGGTVDITAHEVLDGGGLKELHRSSGGYYGGTCVNNEIMSFFERIFGETVLMTLKDYHQDDYLELLNTIEMKKCTYRLSADQKNINIRIPYSLIIAYEKMTECKIDKALENSFVNDVSMVGDKIIISKDLFKTFFEKSIKNVIKIIREVLDSPELADVNTLLVVGGYAESTLITDSLKTVFSQKKIVIPTDPSLSVLKGAVIYGFEPEIIASRVCRYTYGIAKQGVQKKGDPESKLLPEKTKKGFHWCDGVFDKHVEIGQVVKIGEFQETRTYFAVDGQEKAFLDFYASSKKNPRFVDEPDCICIGYIVLDLSERSSAENILVRICFGGTELEVEAMEENTGRVFRSFCNFLP